MIKSARKFAADCGKAGSDWDGDVEEKIRHGLQMAAVVPSFEEELEIFEAWWCAREEVAT